MTSSWLFPPHTREVQFDEKWAFVGKKRWSWAVVPGARSAENATALVAEIKQRLGALPKHS